MINILRKGKDISKNDKIKGLIERYQNKIKKEIENNFVRYGGIIVALFRIMNAQEFILSSLLHEDIPQQMIPGRIEQSVMCLATDVCLTADPGVSSLILARSHNFLEIDREIITVNIANIHYISDCDTMECWVIKYSPPFR